MYYGIKMIIISTLPDSNGDLLNAITTKNVVIKNNVCGVISFVNGMSQYSNTFNSTKITDVNCGILITGNTCKIISSFDGLGQDLTSQDINIFPMTGSFNISDNVCSWDYTNTKRTYEFWRLRTL